MVDVSVCEAVCGGVGLGGKTADGLGFKWLCHFGASHSEFPHESNGRNPLIHRVIAEGGCEVAL